MNAAFPAESRRSRIISPRPKAGSAEKTPSAQKSRGDASHEVGLRPRRSGPDEHGDRQTPAGRVFAGRTLPGRKLRQIAGRQNASEAGLKAVRAVVRNVISRSIHRRGRFPAGADKRRRGRTVMSCRSRTSSVTNIIDYSLVSRAMGRQAGLITARRRPSVPSEAVGCQSSGR